MNIYKEKEKKTKKEGGKYIYKWKPKTTQIIFGKQEKPQWNYKNK